MSFALEYRKKMQADTGKTGGGGKKARARIRPADFVVSPAKKSSDTRGNRRRALAALMFAGLILAVFNSGGLVRYAGGLGYNQAALRVMIASEDWHGMMERSRMTALVDGIRGAVTAARQSNWRDLAFGIDLTPTHPYLTGPETARSADAPRSDEADQEQAAPETKPELREEAPETPVMRAAIER